MTRNRMRLFASCRYSIWARQRHINAVVVGKYLIYNLIISQKKMYVKEFSCLYIIQTNKIQYF